jgi:hypothetical protein
MKLNYLLVSPLIALLAAGRLSAEPFTYQGRLENSGMPFTGAAGIRLSLYAAIGGGSPLRTETFFGVPVTDGIFTVKAVSFLPADFNGSARFLEIEVSSDGTAWTPLTPRQEVTWSPMAMHAKIAETVTGAVAAAQLTGTLSPALLGTGSVGGSVTFAPAAGAPFSVNSTTKVANLNSDLLDGLDSGVFLQKTGGTMTGDLALNSGANVNFGSTVRQMLNLWGTEYGIGVQADTLYQRSNNDFSWFKGGVHSDLRNGAGSGGTEAMRLMGATSTLWLRPGTSATPRGRILFGDLNGSNSNPYVSIGEAQDDDDTLDITAEKIRLFSNSNTPASIHFGQNIGQALTFFQNATENFGIGVQGYTQYFRTSDQFSWYKGGVHANNRGDPGSGGTTLMSLEGNGNLTLGGALSTTVLTIRGGADVAEPFETTAPGDLEPGTVVVIDENHAGKLKLSTEVYDTKVAGIVSGAGGVKPGLRLQQDGVLEGDHPVALSGRVYVKADASTNAIRPGDLLTTSATPGHAMKVADPTKSQGAILGKAMTALESGTGLVLVLVTLQ